MHFLDLKAQQEQLLDDGKTLRAEIDRRIAAINDNCKFIQGPEVNELEESLAKFVGSKNCISVSSGTDALLIALMALDIKDSDEVITTPFSFIATAETILMLGAKPVFVDIEKDSYNIDPLKIEEKITSKTKAIIAVSLYGQPANFNLINNIAKKHNIPVIEDGAQSFGATHHNKKSCNLSTIGTTSFFPSKPLGCYGDGGACFTNDDELASKMKRISLHGQEKRYFHTEIGVNGRIDTYQAAILLAKLPIFKKEIDLRQKVADYYTAKLKSIGFRSTPKIAEYNTSVFAQYTILFENREQIRIDLQKSGIPTAVHYPTILPLQPAISKIYGEENISNSLFNSFDLSKKVVSLPFYPYLSSKDQDLVISKIDSIINC